MDKAASVSAPLLFNITNSEHSTKINIPDVVNMVDTVCVSDQVYM